MDAERAPRAAAPLRVLLLSFLGLGLVPWAPGTAAALGVTALIGLSAQGTGTALVTTLALLAFGVVVTLTLSVRAGGPDGHADPGWVVSDEVAGQALACLGALHLGGWIPLLAAFVLFRVLDIVKPGPIGALERVPRGWGVLLDDLAAGALSGAAVALAGLAGAPGFA